MKGKITIIIGNKTYECDGTETVKVFVEGLVSQSIFEFTGEHKKYVLKVTKDSKLLLN